MASRKKETDTPISNTSTGRRKTAPPPVTLVEVPADTASALTALRSELPDLTVKVAEMQKSATAAVTSGAGWADAKAHEKLGVYPWAKIAGTAVVTVAAAGLIRRLPFGALLAAAVPVVISKAADGDGANRRWFSKG